VLQKVRTLLTCARRFGDPNDARSLSPLYKILSVPSRTLGTHNLEILVSALNVDVARTAGPSTADSSMDAVLVPKLQATSARGSPVPYPVHKTLVLGDGLDSAIAFGKFIADGTTATDMLKVAIDLPPPAEAFDNRATGSTPVNIDIGTQALQALRTSVKNSTLYERNWFASNLPILSNWLTQGLQPIAPTAFIKPAQASLIVSVLDNIEENINSDEARQLASSGPTTANSADQLPVQMTEYAETWLERGHEELRDSLDEAFMSKTWRRLAWWKLFWRVDDVGMVLEEVLERRWLVNAEKDAVFLAGRMKQAGFPDTIPQMSVIKTADEQRVTVEQHEPTSPPLASYSMQTDLTTEVKQQVPWLTILPSTRALLLLDTLSPLHALAQRLILATLSTVSISSALSALLYVSIEAFSVFEASTIAALGIVFSLRRMQNVWEGAREGWMVRVREDGRQALKETERVLRTIVGRKLGEKVVDDGMQDRKAVREVVRRAREALENMGGRGDV
jgi:hypothetical protein